MWQRPPRVKFDLLQHSLHCTSPLLHHVSFSVIHSRQKSTFESEPSFSIAVTWVWFIPGSGLIPVKTSSAQFAVHMQHVTLCDFFPLLLNNHSFVSGSAWKHQFTTINLFCLSFLIPLTLLYKIHSCKLSRQEYFKHKDILIFQDECPPHTRLTLKSAFQQVFHFHTKRVSSVPNSGSVSPLPRANRAEESAASWKLETMRGKFHNYHPARHLTNKNEATREN